MTNPTQDNILDEILKKYSYAVQDLIAGHTPFDDSVQASRYVSEAKKTLKSTILYLLYMGVVSFLIYVWVMGSV
jgi:hypothetical protein